MEWGKKNEKSLKRGAREIPEVACPTIITGFPSIPYYPNPP